MGARMGPDGNPRRKLVHLVLKYVEDRAPREIFNDDLASGLGITREQARSCVNNYLRAHGDDAEIAETRPWYYVWNGARATPVSGVPQSPAAALNGAVGCDFKLVRAVDDDHAVLTGPEASVWLAERVKLQ